MKKFGAKRITALTMALALVTIGGVYATWSYSEGSVASNSQGFNITLASMSSSSSSGTYTIEKSTLIYRVDQYSSALEQLANYATTNTYSTSTYDFIQTGGGTTITDPYNTSYKKYDTKNNYAYQDSGTKKYRTVTSTEVYDNNSALYESSIDSSTVNWAASPTETIDNYTAALCTYTGSYLRVIFTPDASTQGNDTYTKGVMTNFNFTWNGSQPTITVDSDYKYSSTGNGQNVYNLDTSSFTIYPVGSNANRVWTLYNSGGDYYFYYDITGEELVTYLTINKIILTSSTDYTAFSSVALNAAFTLNVSEDTATVLATPSIGYTSTSTVTISAGATYSNGELSNYLLSIYDAETNGNLVATINVGTATSYEITTSNFSGIASGTYYIRVRAIANTNDVGGIYYENSELSSTYVKVTWDGSSTFSDWGESSSNSI